MSEHDDPRRGAPFRVSVESAQGEFLRKRGEALVVGCTVCGQPPGEACLNTVSHTPLRHLPAHESRARDAQARADRAGAR